MSNTPHAKLRKEICEYLKSIGAWYVSTNSQGYGRKGIPDILCCFKGRFVAIEVKVLPDKPNKWQLRELYGDGDKYVGVTETGGLAIVAYKLEEVSHILAKEDEPQLGQLAHDILNMHADTPTFETYVDEAGVTRVKRKALPFRSLYKK